MVCVDSLRGSVLRTLDVGSGVLVSSNWGVGEDFSSKLEGLSICSMDPIYKGTEEGTWVQRVTL